MNIFNIILLDFTSTNFLFSIDCFKYDLHKGQKNIVKPVFTYLGQVFIFYYVPNLDILMPSFILISAQWTIVPNLDIYVPG